MSYCCGENGQPYCAECQAKKDASESGRRVIHRGTIRAMMERLQAAAKSHPEGKL